MSDEARSPGFTASVGSRDGTPPVDIVKPFLKWVGGKTQMIHDVSALFPGEINNYHEPFVGGGSVLLAMLSKRKQGAIRLSGAIYASDLNANLIWLYKHVQSNPDGLIDRVKALSDELSACTGTVVHRKPTSMEEARTSPESYYYWVRSRFNSLSNEERESVDASAMLLFLNKTCFRGVYREGPNGFNVPFGNYKRPSILDATHIRAVSALIREVVFTHRSFGDSLAHLEANDFVYLDPPYAPLHPTSFVSYTSDGFHPTHHAQLFQLCTGMSAKGVKMLMSNADVALVRDAFPSPAFNTQVINCRRAIHSRQPDARSDEVLITNV